MPRAYIGMGGNVDSFAGPPEATLTAAALRLESLGRIVCRSSLYSTEPVGFAAQPRFINAVVALETELEPRELLERLLGIELEFGRDRSAGILNGPRTLDLDILLYGDRVIREPGLEIPHPRLGERQFVLIPLAEIASNVIDVTQQTTVEQLLYALLHGSPDQTNADAVLPVKSEIWRAGACLDDVTPADNVCPGSGGADPHGGG
jgi:2-amino-4-hydroxy-6-hydroxymethyldihydropteridine diphosphokinase